jgi:hypothetical protein
MKTDFTQWVINGFIAFPEVQKQQPIVEYNGNSIIIRSKLWDKHLSLQFIKHSNTHFEGSYCYQFTLENGEKFCDMPISIDCLMREDNGKFYDFGWINQTRFDDPKNLFYESVLVPLLVPIYRKLTLKDIIWGTGNNNFYQYAMFDHPLNIDEIDPKQTMEEYFSIEKWSYQDFLNNESVNSKRD